MSDKKTCLKCKLEGVKKCKCQIKETNFHHVKLIGHSHISQEIIVKNSVGEYALREHTKGVRNVKINDLANQYHDQKFFRTSNDKKNVEELEDKRAEMQEIFQQVLRSLKLGEDLKSSLVSERNLEKSIFKILVQSTSKSPLNILKSLSTSNSSGSGFLVDAKNRYIVTNGHVVKDAEKIVVESAGNSESQFEARVVCVSFDLDIAIIEISSESDVVDFDKLQFQALKICRDQERTIDKIVKLDKSHCSFARLTPIYAVGYPLGSSTFQISSGIISGFEGISDELAIQITAPISHGSSGGALLNGKGEVIGVTSSGVPTGANVGFAIPNQTIINMLETIDLQKKMGVQMKVLKLPYFGLRLMQGTKNQRIPLIEINDTTGEVEYQNENVVDETTTPDQPGVLITKIDSLSIFNRTFEGNTKIHPYDRLVEFNDFTIDDYGNTGEETYPRTMPVQYVFRSCKFYSKFTAKFSRNGKTFVNEYSFEPLKPEEEYPIRPLFAEEFEGNEKLTKEFTPTILGDQVSVFRLNSDFIAFAGDELPEVQRYKEISLIKEPLLLVIADKKKFIEKPELLDTINGIKMRTIDDLKQLEGAKTLVIRTMQGDITIVKMPNKEESATKTIDIATFKKLLNLE